MHVAKQRLAGQRLPGTIDSVNASSNLAARYRPRRFGELTGQRHVAAVLSGAVAQGRMPQQLLLTGGSGLGKTTVARIAAAAVLCETALAERDAGDACGSCRSCTLIAKPQSEHPDVIELDAASHGGKDEIVAIVSRAQTRPLLGQFKVYIIDEVHALSGAGVQAFLKLLEEPPDHVLFMLATTNPEKLSSRAGGTGTIRGRCIEFELLPPTEAELTANLLRVAKGEGWSLTDDVAAMVVDVSDPSLGVRGTINTLAKLSSVLQEGHTPQPLEVTALLGATPRQTIADLTEAIRRRDLAGALELLGEARRFSSDRRVRDALVRWARNGLDASLRGEASFSPQLALQRFELLLEAPEGALHTDLVVARLAQPATITDAETLAAQLHEAHRVLSRLDLLLPNAAELVARSPAAAAPRVSAPTGNGHAAGDDSTDTDSTDTDTDTDTDIDSTNSGAADKGALERDFVGQDPSGGVGDSVAPAAPGVPHGYVGGPQAPSGPGAVRATVGDRDELQHTSGIAGTFDDLSDLTGLGGRGEPGAAHPTGAKRPGDATSTAAPGDAPAAARKSQSGRQRAVAAAGPSAAGGEPSVSGSEGSAGHHRRVDAVDTLSVELFAAAVRRRSATAAALVRSVEVQIAGGDGGPAVVLRVPEGLLPRVHGSLSDLQAAAAELSATVTVVGADAEPDRRARSGSFEKRKDVP